MALDFVAIDFETANYDRSSACAVGLAIVRDGRVVQTLKTLIRPPTRFFLFTDLHNISPRLEHPELGLVVQEKFEVECGSTPTIQGGPPQPTKPGLSFRGDIRFDNILAVIPSPRSLPRPNLVGLFRTTGSDRSDPGELRELAGSRSGQNYRRVPLSRNRWKDQRGLEGGQNRLTGPRC